MKEEEIKFLHINTKITPDIQSALQEVPKRSGMYNWMFLFKGEMKAFNFMEEEDWKKFNVFHINMSPIDMHLIPKVRRKIDQYNPNAILVLNNDYVCETWDIAFQMFPDYYDEFQRYADMLFTTEPHQASNMLNGAFVIPHPTQVEYLKKIRSHKVKNTLGVIYHWWSGDTYIPSRTSALLKKQLGFDYVQLYGYIKESRDKMEKWGNMMWDVKIGGMNFVDYADHIASNKLIYEPCNYHTYGRNTVETACYKVPVVGSDRVYSMKLLYPFTCCDPYDKNKTIELATKLMKDNKFRKKVIDYAFERVEMFNYENSKNAFLQALNVCIERGGHKFYERQE